VSLLFPSQVTRFHIVKLRITIGNYIYTLGAVPKPCDFAFNLATAEINSLMHGLSNYGTHTPPGRPHCLLVRGFNKIWKYKMDKNLKKSSKHSSHIYLLKLSSPGNIIYLIPALIRYLKYQLISCFHRALLQSITFIDRLNALDYTKLTG